MIAFRHSSALASVLTDGCAAIKQRPHKLHEDYRLESPVLFARIPAPEEHLFGFISESDEPDSIYTPSTVMHLYMPLIRLAIR
jgi:hypothetical protein